MSLLFSKDNNNNLKRPSDDTSKHPK